MRGNLKVLAMMTAVWIGVLGYVLTTRAQQRNTVPQPPAGAAGQQAAPQAGQRAGQRAGGQRGQQGLPGTESGWSAFQTRCAVCHLNPVMDLATPGTVIRQMTQERIYESLMTGSMKEKSEGLSDIQKRRIAEFLSGRPMGSSKAGSAA